MDFFFDANLGDEVVEFGRLLLKNFFDGGIGRGIVKMSDFLCVFVDSFKEIGKSDSFES